MLFTSGSSAERCRLPEVAHDKGGRGKSHQHTVLNRLRYSAGVVSSFLRNARLSVSVVLKPQAAAMRSSGSSVVSSRLRAISTRTDSM